MVKLKMHKIKVLWVANVPLEIISKAANLPTVCFGGWLNGAYNSIKDNQQIELFYAFPHPTLNPVKGKAGSLYYCSFLQPKIPFLNISTLKSNSTTVNDIRNIIETIKPDILHIWGTEFDHSYIAASIFDNPAKTVINIQGLVSVYADHYLSGLPEKMLHKFVLSSILRGTITGQARSLATRGKKEIEVVKLAGHIIGRTDWDRACTYRLNPSAVYHHIGEILRPSFYGSLKWNYENCEKYSIFLSQATTPIKGLHFMLKALPDIISDFPKTKVYIAGPNFVNQDTLKNRLKLSPYGYYILQLIKENKLENHICFLGNLSEEEMRDRYLKSHVFVSPSTVENESNSVSEAGILGVPIVASFVGGLTRRLANGEDSFLYQHDAPYMLAHYIMEIFRNETLAKNFSKSIMSNFEKRCCKEHISQKLLNLYLQIAQY